MKIFSMDSPCTTQDYVFHPHQVASTLWRRYQSGVPPAEVHALCCSADPDGVTLRVPLRPESAVDLFRLRVSTKRPANCLLETVFGVESLTLSEIEASAPDPLWDSCDGICSHMEKDHADTFALFIRMSGMSTGDTQAAILMPWIESSGFFLSCLESPIFVPFPKRCESANSVRATLITMLRGARAANSQ